MIENTHFFIPVSQSLRERLADGTANQGSTRETSFADTFSRRRGIRRLTCRLTATGGSLSGALAPKAARLFFSVLVSMLIQKPTLTADYTGGQD
ncbi:MAG: hypothetical protein PVG32_18140 [Anaerolineales bacterium]